MPTVNADSMADDSVVQAEWLGPKFGQLFAQYCTQLMRHFNCCNGCHVMTAT